eukprot:gene29741-38881_t
MQQVDEVTVDRKEINSESNDSHQKLQPSNSNSMEAQNRRLLLSEIIEHKLHRNLSHAEDNYQQIRFHLLKLGFEAQVQK